MGKGDFNQRNYELIPKRFLDEYVIEVCPLDDIGKGIVPHTGFMALLSNNEFVIVEHGAFYWKK